MSSSARQSLTWSMLGLLAALLLGVAGGILLRDEPGLKFEFFSLTVAWEGKPEFSDVRPPKVDNLAELSVSPNTLFSVRWRGWLMTEKPGPYIFRIWAEDSGYLSLDGVEVLDNSAPRGKRREKATIDLAAGLHAIEIGLVQRDHQLRGPDLGLGIEWTPPGEEPAVLPTEVLYARRPVGPYRLLRRVTEPLSPVVARLLGAWALGLGLLSLRAGWRRRPRSWTPPEAWRGVVRRVGEWLKSPIAGPRNGRQVLLVVGLASFFLVVWANAFPRSVATLAGDDAAYLMASQVRPESLWYFNRMVHVYLLKVFVFLFGGGDAFLGSRIYGSFVFAATLTALVVAVRALGPKLQLRTLAVILFLFFSQTAITGALGAPFADYTLMMFLTLAAAVYLHGRSVEKQLPGLRWHAFALGALTLAACKSKETGVIVFFLSALFLWTRGGVDWRRIRRRLAYWSAGLGIALLVLMIADALWMGDFLWAVRPENYADGGKIFYNRMTRLDSAAIGSAPESGWMRILWPEGARGAGRGLGILWLLALAAPLVAAFRKVSHERRIFYLFPATFLLMLVLIYSRSPRALHSARILIPILPAACLVAGALFYHLGIERVTWKQILSVRVFVPIYLAATLIVLVVTPYLAGEFTAETLVPADLAARYGWQPEQFLSAVEIPALMLAGVLVTTLVFHRRQARLAVALIATFAFLHVSFELSRSSLAHRFVAQRGEVMLYPWRVFEEQIETLEPDRVHVSTDLVWRLRMFGDSYRTVSLIFFGRQVDVTLTDTVPDTAEVAIASRNAYNRWRRVLPGLEATATFDPTGQLVLLEPLKAAGVERSRE